MADHLLGGPLLTARLCSDHCAELEESALRRREVCAEAICVASAARARGFGSVPFETFCGPQHRTAGRYGHIKALAALQSSAGASMVVQSRSECQPTAIDPRRPIADAVEPLPLSPGIHSSIHVQPSQQHSNTQSSNTLLRSKPSSISSHSIAAADRFESKAERA